MGAGDDRFVTPLGSPMGGAHDILTVAVSPTSMLGIEDISDEEEEARRQAKQDYYNAQIALGNMRVQLPKPGEAEV